MSSKQNLAGILKKARQARGLSQRELATASGLTQAYISRVESGTTDIGVGTLTELARTLGLEVKLIPRQAIPAVDAIIRSVTQDKGDDQPLSAYRLEENDDA